MRLIMNLLLKPNPEPMKRKPIPIPVIQRTLEKAECHLESIYQRNGWKKPYTWSEGTARAIIEAYLDVTQGEDDLSELGD